MLYNWKYYRERGNVRTVRGMVLLFTCTQSSLDPHRTSDGVGSFHTMSV